MSRTAEEADRYSRQLLLRELGEAGQGRLGGARVEVSGHSPAALVAATYLVAGGTAVSGLAGGVRLSAAGFTVAAAEVGRSLAEVFAAAAADLNPSSPSGDLPRAWLGDVTQDLPPEGPAVALGSRAGRGVVVFRGATSCARCFAATARSLETGAAFADQVVLGALAALAMQRLLWGIEAGLGVVEALPSGALQSGEWERCPACR